MGKYFGTDGIRGRANDTLRVDTVYKIGLFIGNYYRGEKGILIGRDTRLSGAMFEKALTCGIVNGGSNAYVLGICSTPSLAYLAMKEGFACGCMISASHNPYYDNGVKIFSNQGIKIPDELEEKIEAYIDDPQGIDIALDDQIGQAISCEELLYSYREWLKELYPARLDGMKILVDLANGSNCLIAKEVLAQTGIDADFINDSFNGININNHCGSTHLEQLQEEIMKGDYDLGFAFDGDADRVLFVNNEGKVVDGDQIMYLCAKYLKKKGKLRGNALVTTVMSNIGLFKAMKELDIHTEITAVGDRNVLNCMMDNDYIIGGEQSGHIICRLDSDFGDGIKTALLVLGILKEEGITLQEAVNNLIIYPQLTVNLKVQDKKVVMQDEEVLALAESLNKELENNGRILVRSSGTEPLVRVTVEADSDEACEKYADQMIALIRKKGYATA